VAGSAPTNDALEQAQTVPALLGATARLLVSELSATACTISRAIGDLLVDLVDYSAEGPVQTGHGYLISDFPATREVLEGLEARAVYVADPDADRHEVELLRQVGFDSLLMLSLACDGKSWGLVEVYDRTREGFAKDEIATAQAIVDRASSVLQRLAD
jgi:GAF domain-containing protein